MSSHKTSDALCAAVDMRHARNCQQNLSYHECPVASYRSSCQPQRRLDDQTSKLVNMNLSMNSWYSWQMADTADRQCQKSMCSIPSCTMVHGVLCHCTLWMTCHLTVKKLSLSFLTDCSAEFQMTF